MPWLDISPGILTPGDRSTATAWVHNRSGQAMEYAAVKLVLPPGIASLDNTTLGTVKLRAGEARMFTWRICPTNLIGVFPIRLEARSGSLCDSRTKWLSVVAKRDTQREFRNQSGAWLPFPSRPILQIGNTHPIREIKTLPSSKMKGNLFGVTAHIPRSVDDEDPFRASHAVDGDLDSNWASRWWTCEIPRTPEWIETDLGAIEKISEVRFLPSWQNAGAPKAFTIEVSADRRKWTVLADETDFVLQEHEPGSSLRHGALNWQCFKCSPARARYVKLTCSRLGGGPTGFFLSPGGLFQLRIAELVALDDVGKRLGKANSEVRVSSTHTAWYNSPETTERTWPLLLKSGVKLNRIGQWGDKTDWAIVEKSKGKYVVDEEMDRLITGCVDSGVDIIMTLSYGNNLYQQVKNGADYGPTWQHGHPFLQCAPTTKEAVEAFSRYCGYMAKHFRGRVKYFEIWNEPNAFFFDDWKTSSTLETAKAFGRALAPGAKAIKEANPGALVVSGGTCGYGMTPDYVRTILEQGAAPYIDVVGFHPYGRATPESRGHGSWTLVGDHFEFKPVPSEWLSYEDEVRALRKVVDGFNPCITLSANEVNWFASGDPPMPEMGDLSELTQAKYLSRLFALNAWLDCSVVWWTLCNTNYTMDWALLRSGDLTPRPSYYAATYISTVLDGCRGTNDRAVDVVAPAVTDLVVKCFRSIEGANVVGLWRSACADDGCQPVAVTLRFAGQKSGNAEILDALYGVRQEAVVSSANGNVLIKDLLVGDWPVFWNMARPTKSNWCNCAR